MNYLEKEIFENYNNSFISTFDPYSGRNSYPYNVHPQIQESMGEFLLEALSQQRGKFREIIKGMKLGGHRDEEKRIYAGGYDQAIENVLQVIEEKPE